MIESVVHPNIETLRRIYAELSTIGEYLHDSAVLHPAAPAEDGALVFGKDAVIEHELALIRATENTLFMDVQNIIANDHFGAVVGTLRATVHGNTIGMPFCGLWRFRNGLILEHWENAYDAAEFGRFLAGNPVPAYD